METAELRQRSSNDRLANEVVRIYKEYVGRGPTKARVYITNGVVTCVLHDSLTKAERTLAENGHAEEVRSLRRKFQDTMEAALTAAVEKELERGVVAFLSDHHVDPDIAIETFVLRDREGQPLDSQAQRRLAASGPGPQESDRR